MKLEGLEDVIEAMRRLPTSLDRQTVFDDVSQQFSARLRAATPLGYSGRLRDSVVFESDDEQAVVGYEEGVEKAGNPKLDSVTRPNTSGRSVLRWTPADELEGVMEETFAAYSPDGVSLMESRLAEQINGGS